MKKTLSFVLAFLLLFSTHSSALALETKSQTISQEGTTGFCIWELYDDGTLIIKPNEEYASSPLYGRMGFYSYSTPPWRDDVKELVIEDGVVYIGNGAFSGCKKLTDISIADTVTTIGLGAFDNSAFYYDEKNWENDVLYCGKYLLNSKDNISGSCKIREGTEYIASYAFSNSYVYGEEDARQDLYEVIMPKSLKRVGESAFCQCRNLNSVVISENVDYIGENAFNECNNLKSVVLPKNISYIGYQAFGYYSYYVIHNGIASYEYSKVNNFTIYGTKESEAEIYATENGFNFVALDENNVNIGDANGDNSIDILDATAVQKYASGKGELTAEQISAVDVNNDGVVDILDAAEIQKYAAGIITEFKKKG